ncbi:hypothetical protein V8F33_004323 [Rhypophila sp. PSN 637]
MSPCNITSVPVHLIGTARPPVQLDAPRIIVKDNNQVLQDTPECCNSMQLFPVAYDPTHRATVETSLVSSSLTLKGLLELSWTEMNAPRSRPRQQFFPPVFHRAVNKRSGAYQVSKPSWSLFRSLSSASGPSTQGHPQAELRSSCIRVMEHFLYGGKEAIMKMQSGGLPTPPSVGPGMFGDAKIFAPFSWPYQEMRSQVEPRSFDICAFNLVVSRQFPAGTNDVGTPDHTRRLVMEY